jgi:uncharacterized protein
VAKFRFVQWLWDWLLALHEYSFEWDSGKSTKSVQKHNVSCAEAEEVFTQRRFVPLGQQYQPHTEEPRFGTLGETASGKLSFIAFTLRRGTIRIISARPMNDKEQAFYASLRQESARLR